MNYKLQINEDGVSPLLLKAQSAAFKAKLDAVDVNGLSGWHHAAKNKTLNTIPKHLFSKKSLIKGGTIEDCYGTILKTPFNIAASWDGLKDIPEKFFTEETLSMEDYCGNTIWHLAAYSSSLNDIPKHLFSEKSLKIRNKDGKTVLHIAAARGNLTDIPDKFLTVKNLSDAGFFNSTNYQDPMLQKKVIKSLVELNQTLKKEILNIDPRLKITKAEKNCVYFSLNGDESLGIILNKIGISSGKEKYKTFCEAIKALEDSKQTMFNPEMIHYSSFQERQYIPKDY